MSLDYRDDCLCSDCRRQRQARMMAAQAVPPSLWGMIPGVPDAAHKPRRMLAADIGLFEPVALRPMLPSDIGLEDSPAPISPLSARILTEGSIP